jgi:hypothetical protein
MIEVFCSNFNFGNPFDVLMLKLLREEIEKTFDEFVALDPKFKASLCRDSPSEEAFLHCEYYFLPRRYRFEIDRLEATWIEALGEEKPSLEDREVSQIWFMGEEGVSKVLRAECSFRCLQL